MMNGETACRMTADARRAGNGESRDDAVGPQGAALILELQRLRQAFEQEDGDAPHAPQARRPAREEPPAASQARTRQPKRQRRGKMGRAFDICLEQLGLTATAPAARRSENAPEPPAASDLAQERTRVRAGFRPDLAKKRAFIRAGCRTCPAQKRARIRAGCRPDQAQKRASTRAGRHAGDAQNRAGAQGGCSLRPREEANPNVSRHPRRRRAGAARSSRPTTPSLINLRRSPDRKFPQRMSSTSVDACREPSIDAAASGRRRQAGDGRRTVDRERAASA